MAQFSRYVCVCVRVTFYMFWLGTHKSLSDPIPMPIVILLDSHDGGFALDCYPYSSQSSTETTVGIIITSVWCRSIGNVPGLYYSAWFGKIKYHPQWEFR